MPRPAPSRRRLATLLATVSTAAALGVAASPLWAAPASAAAADTTDAPRAQTAGRAGAAVEVADSRFGRILTDSRGLTLYLFTRDGRGPSRCYGACAEAWPPLLTTGEPRARDGARRRHLGTVRRTDGTRQVTYRGQPLYYYFREDEAGEILCQDVEEFGGTWLVVNPAGKAVR